MKRMTLIHGGGSPTIQRRTLPIFGALLVSISFLSGCGVLVGESFEDRPPPAPGTAGAPDGSSLGEGGGPGATPPADGVIDLSMEGNSMCVVTGAHTLACTKLSGTPPSGMFDRVSVGDSYGTCAMGTDRSLRCWNAVAGSKEQDSAPQGKVQAVTVGYRSCAIQSDRFLCWGSHPPSDEELTSSLNAVSPIELVSGLDVCTRSSSGVVRCLSPLVEPFNARSLAVSDTLACAVETATNRPRCWTYVASPAEVILPAPDGSFEKVAVDGVLGVACGIREDDTIQCWGASSKSQKLELAEEVASVVSQVPPGKYKKVDVGFARACAIRDDGTLVCWGNAGPPELVGPDA